jgi:putative ABC transport system permease protein
MILNYFKLAFRNLRLNKSYAFINVSGLAIGIAASLLIFVVIRYEMSYNQDEPNVKSIYRIITQDKNQEGISYNPGIPFPALEALRTDLPDITSGALFACYGTQVSIPSGTKGQDKKFIEDQGLFFCDQDYLNIFTYKWLNGDPSVLKEPNTIVLTRKLADKYFGNWENAMGKQLRIDNTMDMKVAGILENPPLNTDFPVTMFGSFVTMKNNNYYSYTTDWGSTTSNFQIYMLLPPSVSESKLNSRLAGLANKYYRNEGINKRVNLLQALEKIHFDTEVPGLGDHTTNKSTLLTLSLIGFLIIFMACINFINLSTAQAVKRSKEIGVRKVLGSNRMQIFLQVISETKLIVLVSTLAGILVAWLSLPYIGHIISINEPLSLFSLQNFLFIISVIIVVTLLSGLYPAFVLSGFEPIRAIRNKVSSASVGGISLRRGLVVTQFAISQILIVGTIVAISQMNFIRTADLGFNKEAIIVINSSTDSSVLVRQKPFKESLLQIPGVKLVSLCSDVPSSNNNSSTNFAFEHKPDENFGLYTKFADADYFKTFELQFAAGEPYITGDTSGKVVVNETLLSKLNVTNPEDAIGKQIRTGGGRWRSICGVVKDFKTNSLKEQIKPLMLAPRRSQFGVVAVKVQSTNLSVTQANIQKIWDKQFPEYAYDSVFMDETIEEFYKQESQMALLYKIFAGLAIFISCLGLYGLVSFMAVQKTKEVGIRKVLGASVMNIVLLFSKEFTILVGIAFIIAAPLGWYFMNNWLTNFAYRITIEWYVFLISVTISITVAWIAVGYKALRTAVTNPVKSLRTE